MSARNKRVFVGLMGSLFCRFCVSFSRLLHAFTNISLTHWTNIYTTTTTTTTTTPSVPITAFPLLSSPLGFLLSTY